MKVIIFGATGGTGRELVAQSIEADFETSVFVHQNVTALNEFVDKVTVYRGDVRNFTDVDEAVKAHDVVLVALGVIPGKTNEILSLGTANIVHAMELSKVKRLVVETGAGLAEDKKAIPFLWRFMSALPPMRGMFTDKRKQEAIVRRSSLEWVIVRPSNLTSGPRTNKYKAGDKLPLRTLSTISRADVAHFMLTQVSDDAWLGRAVTISSS